MSETSEKNAIPKEARKHLHHACSVAVAHTEGPYRQTNVGFLFEMAQQLLLRLTDTGIKMGRGNEYIDRIVREFSQAFATAAAVKGEDRLNMNRVGYALDAVESDLNYFIQNRRPKTPDGIVFPRAMA